MIAACSSKAGMPKPFNMGKGAWFWKLAAGWALVIFALSSIPGAAFPASKLLSYDKLVHAGVYAVLGALCFLALALNRGTKTGLLVAIAGVMATLYGCTDELHQLFVPGRSSDLRDVLADAIGGFAGAGVASMAVSALKNGRAPDVDAPSVPPRSNRAS
jgi:VanZ family protein